MWRFILLQLTCVLVSIFLLKAQAATLKAVSSQVDGEQARFQFTFDEAVAAENVKLEFINQTVQINFPKARFSAGPKIDRLNGSRYKTLYTYQATNDLLRARVIQQSAFAASDVKDRIEVKSEGNDVLVTINGGAKITAAAGPRMESQPPTDLNAMIDGQEKDDETEASLPVAKPEPKTNEEILQSELEKTLSTAEGLAPVINHEPAPAVAASAKPIQETQIPLFKSEPKKNSEAGKGLLNGLLASFALILVVSATLIGGARWYRNKFNKPMSTTKIQVLTQMPLGPKKSLAIVHVAGESVLIGITDHNISHIKTLSFIDDEIPERVPKSFTDSLLQQSDAAIDRKIEARSRPQLTAKVQTVDDVNLDSVKDIVTNRLKSMRPI